MRQSIDWMESSEPVEWAPEVNKKTYTWLFIEIPRRLQISIRRPQVNKCSKNEVGIKVKLAELLVEWEKVKDPLKASCTCHLTIHRLILTTSTYRRFSLFAVGIFSKVATNTKLMNSELRENRVRSLWASDHNIDQCYDWPIHTFFYVCFCLETPYLTYC